MRPFSLFIAPLVATRGVYSLQDQVPIIEQTTGDTLPMQNTVDDVAPAIGVHFTISYAVAAARYPNGTIQDLVKLEGDGEYIELMSRWVKTQEARGEDCDSIGRRPSEFGLKRWKCNHRKVTRYVRNLLGLQISHDAAVLTNFLHLLRKALEEQLDTPVTRIAPAIFPLDEPQTQNFQASLERAGLVSSRTWAWDRSLVFNDVNAAYAGVGYGLCEDRRSFIECYSDMNKLDYYDVLWLNFDNHSFTTTVSSLAYVYQEWGTQDYDFHLDLGHKNLPDDAMAQNKFWQSIHEVVVSQVARLSAPSTRMGTFSASPTRIVLMGDYGYGYLFRAAVRAAVYGVRDIDIKILGYSLKGNVPPGRLAARGAAELGWRAEYWQRELVEERKAADARAHELGRETSV